MDCRSNFITYPGDNGWRFSEKGEVLTVRPPYFSTSNEERELRKWLPLCWRNWNPNWWCWSNNDWTEIPRIGGFELISLLSPHQKLDPAIAWSRRRKFNLVFPDMLQLGTYKAIYMSFLGSTPKGGSSRNGTKSIGVTLFQRQTNWAPRYSLPSSRVKWLAVSILGGNEVLLQKLVEFRRQMNTYCSFLILGACSDVTS